jgi:hypothetical protein
MGLEERQRREHELRVEDAELATQLAVEQGRWADFNARLDELEASLRAPR